MKKKSLWAISMATVLMLSGCGKSPESTAKSFYMALGKGEITEAQSYFSSDITGNLGANKLSLALEMKAQQIKSCGGLKSVDVKLDGKGEVRSGTAKLIYSGNCAPDSHEIRLQKEDGNWKMAPS